MTAKDISGQKFGKLIAIRPTDDRKDRSVVWECLCDCGNTHFVASRYLTRGESTSCGCNKTGPREDLSGMRFGRLVVVKPTDARIESQVAWECLCDCGNKRLVRSSALKSGNTQSCGCLQKERQRDAVALDVGEAAFRRLYRGYKRRAKKKNIGFDIDSDDFRRLTSDNCFYCGSETSCVLTEAPSNGVYPYNGLDRIDTTGGYTLDNAVPCCKHCNVAKRAMTQEEFALHITRVYNYWAKDFLG